MFTKDEEMQIESNIFIDGVHDNVKYDPIERQMAKILSSRWSHVDWNAKERVYCLEGEAVVKMDFNKSVELRLTSIGGPFELREYDFAYGHEKPVQVKLRLNTDIEKKVNHFCKRIENLLEIKSRAKPVYEKFLNLCEIERESKTIHNYLDEYFTIFNKSVKLIGAKFFASEFKLFNGFGITFYIHPAMKAPAEGVLFHIESDGSVAPFWNNSTLRRENWGGVGSGNIENIVHRLARFEVQGINFEGIEGMKIQLEILEELERAIKHFNVNSVSCPELIAAHEIKQETIRLHEEAAKQ